MMKRLIGIVLTGALIFGMAASAIAEETQSTPSKTGSDVESEVVEITVSGGSTEGMEVTVKVTEESQAEEAKLVEQGVEGYLGAETAAAVAEILNTEVSNLVINEIKQITISGYESGKGDLTMKVHFAALPEEDTQVCVVIKVVMPDGSEVMMTVSGYVEEYTVVVDGVERKLRCVVFTLAPELALQIQGGKASVMVVNNI